MAFHGNVVGLVTHYNRVTVLVEKGRATDVICLDFCKAFDMALHNILVAKIGDIVRD